MSPADPQPRSPHALISTVKGAVPGGVSVRMEWASLDRFFQWVSLYGAVPLSGAALEPGLGTMALRSGDVEVTVEVLLIRYAEGRIGAMPVREGAELAECLTPLWSGSTNSAKRRYLRPVPSDACGPPRDARSRRPKAEPEVAAKSSSPPDHRAERCTPSDSPRAFALSGDLSADFAVATVLE